MTRSDDTILEWLLNAPGETIAATPGVIAANIEYSRTTVKRRISLLREAGLVEYHDETSGIYAISEKGIAYLDGSLDASELDVDVGDD